MIGTILNNRYELLEKIGEGGMAEVYKAKCHKLNRFDAVKILKKEYANDPSIVEKFKREATAVANLSDNNIVNIYDVGTQGDIHYIVMEYVKGKTLKDIIVENFRLSHERAIDISIQIARALDCAHRNNIIHRDVKPQNILVTEEGVVKVTDFGIAKASSNVTITNSNKVIGSAHYFSPEQARGNFVDARTDIYSLGIVLYEMLTGKVPFDGESPVSIALKHIQDTPALPKSINPSIPDSLNNLVMKAIDKDANNRYQSSRDMINDLLRIQKDLNYEVIPKKVEEEFTRVMDAVNVTPEKNDENPEENKNKNKVSDDYNYGEDKVSKKTKRIIIGVLVCILALALGGTAAFLLKGSSSSNNTSSSSGQISVPDVVGKTEDEAKDIIDKAHLKFVEAEKVANDKPAGTVIQTYPPAGTKVEANHEIRVSISTGPGKTTVPNVENEDEATATQQLKDAGFNPKSAYDYSDTVDAGNVMKQSPDADSEANPGDTVTITVSKGKKIEYAIVPYVKGMNVANAQNALSAQGLKLGNQTTVATTDQSQDGLIATQSVDSGTKLEKGKSVDVTVNKFTPSYVPGVVGQNIDTAKATLTNAGFKVGNVSTTTTTDNSQNNIVAKQTPTGGSQANSGATVDLVYYTYQAPQQQTQELTYVEGMDLASAEQTLKNDNFQIGLETEIAVIPGKQPGTVAKAIQRAGSKIVDIFYYKKQQ
ncbi:Stk1 family PASTA domain-containing Ser/Thr kinase [Clostridium sp. 19966]|uniref:Stk1 family PASTA domain-containing Ser/Thr kinase n=1 Tax=Clostridium sp. 19966 TaxID=2768166 RepID=UPI0028DE22EE|nr:Stk1 family PASTA domain-containing Ser/Thr kinase [Clostridium sp. 19966]MDT8716471.1 Stk1 family PASTA domain-containing Ser/Thr kinase [Clostridium sp. 19966]